MFEEVYNLEGNWYDPNAKDCGFNIDLNKYFKNFEKDIETKNNSKDLEKILDNLFLSFRLTSNSKERAIVHKLLGKLLLKLNYEIDAYEHFRIGLYFCKTCGIKKSYEKLNEEYGDYYRINDKDFNHKLLKNIEFINKNVECDDSIKRNNKYKLNNELVRVENIAMDYYKSLGYECFFVENSFWWLMNAILFDDIHTENIIRVKKPINNYEEFINKIDERLYEFETSDIKKFIEKYMIINRMTDHALEMYGHASKLGIETWVWIINHFGKKNMIKIMKEVSMHVYFAQKFLFLRQSLKK
mgnify:CR=1 FL=1